MKKNTLLKIFIIFLTLTIYSCGNSETKKTDLIYENGNQKVEIQILNGKDYLEYDKPTKTNFILTNIDSTFFVMGPGISVIGRANHPIFETSIKVRSNSLDTDTLKIKIGYGGSLSIKHEFKIPMKTTE